MSYLNQKQKIYKQYDNTENNKIIIEQLVVQNIKTKPIHFNKKQNEIVLVNKELLELSSSFYKRYDYLFSNFNEKYTRWITPIVIFESDSAYNLESDLISFNNFFWWNVIQETNYILKFEIQGIHLFDSNYAPLYVTIKLNINNNQLFTKFKF